MKNKIAQRRKQRFLRQEELAKMVGILPSYLSRIESGKFNPSIKLAMKIAIALKTSVGRLWELDDEEMAVLDKSNRA